MHLTVRDQKLFQGDPCKVCSGTLRYVNGKACAHCQRQRDRRRRAKKIQVNHAVG